MPYLQLTASETPPTIIAPRQFFDVKLKAIDNLHRAAANRAGGKIITASTRAGGRIIQFGSTIRRRSSSLPARSFTGVTKLSLTIAGKRSAYTLAHLAHELKINRLRRPCSRLVSISS